MELIVQDISPDIWHRFQVNEEVSYILINGTTYKVVISGGKVTVTQFSSYTLTAEERQEAQAEPPKKLPPPRKLPYPSADAQWKRESSRKFR